MSARDQGRGRDATPAPDGGKDGTPEVRPEPGPAAPPFEFTGRCDICGELTTDWSTRHRACETAPGTVKP